jgi:hypothetical protein
VQFPCDQEAYSKPNFQALLQACAPARFGRGSEDVLDPQYRKALCLAADKFGLNTTLPLEYICNVRQ